MDRKRERERDIEREHQQETETDTETERDREEDGACEREYTRVVTCTNTTLPDQTCDEWRMSDSKAVNFNVMPLSRSILSHDTIT